MAKDDAARLATIKKLVEAQRKVSEQLQAITDELDDVLGGGIGIGARLNALKAHWKELWRTRHRSEYQFNHAIDTGHLKRFLKAMTDEELSTRMTRYIRSDDAFYTKDSHPFSLFVRSINQWAGPAVPLSESFELGEPVDGCRHTPRCTNAPEHTRRSMQDRRVQA